MEIKAKSRIVIAWVLLITLMPLFVVKAVHFHDSKTSACQSTKGHTHSPFTQAESLQIHVFVSVFDLEPAQYADKVCIAMLYPYHLRAPPTKSYIL